MDIESLRKYVTKTLNKPEGYRIMWPDDVMLADVRNTPFVPSPKPHAKRKQEKEKQA